METAEVTAAQTRPPVPIDPETAREMGIFLAQYMAAQINLADMKASFAIAAAALLAAAATLDRVPVMILFDSRAALLDRLLVVVVLVMFGVLVLSVYHSLLVVRPVVPRPRRFSPFYFASIRRYEPEEYLRQFLAQGRDVLMDELFTQVWFLSDTAHRKFERVRRALNLLMVAFTLWLASQLIRALAA